MMITDGIIQALVEEKLADTDKFIVSAKVHSGNHIKVYIDAIGGLDVKDCINVSRHIEGNLDREVEDYELEVSSPGLTEAYQHPLQYKKNIGRDVKILMADGTRIKGKLAEFNEDSIVVEPEQKKKQVSTEPMLIPISEIKEAKTVISFK